MRKNSLNNNQDGVIHHLMLIVLAVVVTGLVGFAGYRVWQNRNIDAQAASWRTITNYKGPTTISTQRGFSFNAARSTASYRVCLSGKFLPIKKFDNSTIVSDMYIDGTFTSTLSMTSTQATKCTSAKTLSVGSGIKLTIWAGALSFNMSSLQLQILK